MTRRKSEDDAIDTTIPQMVGVITSVLGPKKAGKRKPKRKMKRPIGFMADIDKMEPIDD